jgi:Trm5-related predicted tRNA methylase
MPRVLITAEVENLEAWEKGFRSHTDLFEQMAVSTMEYATVAGNRVAVCGETRDLDAYMKIFNSPATAEAMALDGVKRETVQMFVLDKELTI